MTIRNPNGYGTVVNLGKRRRKPFAARITSGWKISEKTNKAQPIYKYLGFYSSKKEAMLALADYNKLPFCTDNINSTFAELFDLFRCQCKDKYAKSSFVRLEQMYKRLSVFHDKPYRYISMNEIVNFCNDFTPKTFNNVKTFFTILDKIAISNDIPCKNIGTAMISRKLADPKIKEPFSEDEIKILFDNKEAYVCRIALILIYTGWRVSEFCNLLISDIDQENWTLKGGMKTKAGKNRIVPIHPAILPFIQDLISKSKNDKLVNLSAFTIESKFRTELTLYVPKKTPHECRHTFITRLDNLDISRIIINRLAGHASGQVGEDVYTHKTIVQLQEAINKLPSY